MLSTSYPGKRFCELFTLLNQGQKLNLIYRLRLRIETLVGVHISMVFSLLMKAGATKDRPENTLLFFFLAFFGVAFSPRYPKRSDGIYNTSIACPLDIVSWETLGRVELFCSVLEYILV